MAHGVSVDCPLVTPVTRARMRAQFRSQAEYARFRVMWQHDVGQEVIFLISALLLLNSRNAVEREAVSYGKLNRSREKKGKPPILDHTVVRLRIPKGAMGTGSRSLAARASHWVKGHPKFRRTGVFWWSPHVRGLGRDGSGPPVRPRVVKG